MARVVTELTDDDVKQALYFWVAKGCPTYQSDASSKVTLSCRERIRGGWDYTALVED